MLAAASYLSSEYECGINLLIWLLAGKQINVFKKEKCWTIPSNPISIPATVALQEKGSCLAVTTTCVHHHLTINTSRDTHGQSTPVIAKRLAMKKSKKHWQMRGQETRKKIWFARNRFSMALRLCSWALESHVQSISLSRVQTGSRGKLKLRANRVDSRETERWSVCLCAD